MVESERVKKVVDGVSAISLSLTASLVLVIFLSGYFVRIYISFHFWLWELCRRRKGTIRAILERDDEY